MCIAKRTSSVQLVSFLWARHNFIMNNDSFSYFGGDSRASSSAPNVSLRNLWPTSQEPIEENTPLSADREPSPSILPARDDLIRIWNPERAPAEADWPNDFQQEAAKLGDLWNQPSTNCGILSNASLSLYGSAASQPSSSGSASFAESESKPSTSYSSWSDPSFYEGPPLTSARQTSERFEVSLAQETPCLRKKVWSPPPRQEPQPEFLQGITLPVHGCVSQNRDPFCTTHPPSVFGQARRSSPLDGRGAAVDYASVARGGPSAILRGSTPPSQRGVTQNQASVNRASPQKPADHLGTSQPTRGFVQARPSRVMPTTLSPLGISLWGADQHGPTEMNDIGRPHPGQLRPKVFWPCFAVPTKSPQFRGAYPGLYGGGNRDSHLKGTQSSEQLRRGNPPPTSNAGISAIPSAGSGRGQAFDLLGNRSGRATYVPTRGFMVLSNMYQVGNSPPTSSNAGNPSIPSASSSQIHAFDIYGDSNPGRAPASMPTPGIGVRSDAQQLKSENSPRTSSKAENSAIPSADIDRVQAFDLYGGSNRGGVPASMPAPTIGAHSKNLQCQNRNSPPTASNAGYSAVPSANSSQVHAFGPYGSSNHGDVTTSIATHGIGVRSDAQQLQFEKSPENRPTSSKVGKSAIPSAGPGRVPSFGPCGSSNHGGVSTSMPTSGLVFRTTAQQLQSGNSPANRPSSSNAGNSSIPSAGSGRLRAFGQCGSSNRGGGAASLVTPGIGVCSNAQQLQSGNSLPTSSNAGNSAIPSAGPGRVRTGSSNGGGGTASMPTSGVRSKNQQFKIGHWSANLPKSTNLGKMAPLVPALKWPLIRNQVLVNDILDNFPLGLNAAESLLRVWRIIRSNRMLKMPIKEMGDVKSSIRVGLGIVQAILLHLSTPGDEEFVLTVVNASSDGGINDTPVKVMQSMKASGPPPFCHAACLGLTKNDFSVIEQNANPVFALAFVVLIRRGKRRVHLEDALAILKTVAACFVLERHPDLRNAFDYMLSKQPIASAQGEDIINSFAVTLVFSYHYCSLICEIGDTVQTSRARLAPMFKTSWALKIHGADLTAFPAVSREYHILQKKMLSILESTDAEGREMA